MAKIGATGHENVGRGRRKGCKNKATLLREDVVRQILTSLDTRNAKAARKRGAGAQWLDALDDREFAGLLKAIVPKQQSIEVSGGLSWAEMVHKLAEQGQTA